MRNLRLLSLVLTLFTLTIAQGASAMWFDLPRTPNVAFTASNDATLNASTVFDYSGNYLDTGQTVLLLSANVDGFLSANGGPSPTELYVKLPDGKSAQRQQSFPVAAYTRGATGPHVPIAAHAVTTGTVVTIRRVDGVAWPSGGVGFSFSNAFAV